MVTTSAAQRRDRARRDFNANLAECPGHELLAALSDKWLTLVVSALADGPLRYAELSRVVASLPPEVESVVLVGHNPGVEDLVQDLSGGWVPMKTSAIAVLTWEGAWTDAGSARLVASGRPPA